MKQISITAGEGRYQICMNGFLTEGHGICIFMTGGEKPHNGGTVVANPRLKSHALTPNDRTADLWVSCVPGHKDTEIGIPIAKKLAVRLNEAVSLTVGIHIDNANQEEIKLLSSNCEAAAESFIKNAQKE